jgi:PAS domain S-box-containing protein
LTLIKEIANHSGINIAFINEERLSYTHPENAFSIHIRFISDRIIFIKTSGLVNNEYAVASNEMMEYIETAFEKAKKPISFYFINDSTEVSQYLPSASRELQRFFEERIKRNWYQHVAIISNDPIVKLYVNAVNFLKKKKFNSAHKHFDNALSYLNNLISKESDQAIPESIEALLKNESDKEKILRLEQENHQLKNELQFKLDDITEKIRSISTNQNFEPLNFNDTDNSNLTPLYHALNYLNLDIQLLVRNLKEANSELSKNIRDRTYEIRTIEKRLHSVMAFSSDFICLLNNDDRIDYINPAFQNFIKALYKVDIKTGEKWSAVFPDEIKELSFDLLQNADKEGEARKYIAVKNIHIDFTATILIENKQVEGYLIIGRNISELSETLQELKKSKKRYKFITDNLNDVIWTRKSDHVINFISSSIYRQRGFKPEEYTGLPLEESMTDESIVRMKKIIDNKSYLHYSKEKPLVFRGDYLKKDGSIMHGETYVYPVFNKGKLNRIMGITRDISDRIEYLNKIEQQKSELESILNNTDEQIISLNLNFEYVTLNNVARKVINDNFSADPSIGDSIFNYMSTDNAQKIKVAFRKVLKGENFHYVFRVRRKEKMEYLDARFRPIFLNNEVFGISMFIKNISENIYTQIALRENEQRLKRITNTALEGVWEYTSKNKMLYLSPRLKELVGYKGRDDLNEFIAYIKNVMNYDDLLNFTQSLVFSIKKHKNIEIATKVKLEDEREKWLLVRASVSYNLNKDPQTISGVLIDITKQKEQEEELKLAKDKAEETSKLKSNFLANMSHEVRTPLNGILGVTQLLEKEGLPEEINYYLDLQKKSGFRLLETINNILSISRLESSPKNEELKAIELNQFIKNNVASFKILCQQKGLELRIDSSEDELCVPINEHLFYQVFNNLLGNAIKFTVQGYVEIKTEKRGNYAAMTISDTGIGISNKFKAKLFDAFEQESTGINRNFEGSGLGLAIVKKYVDKINGEILVKSKKGKGTSFTIMLPL